MKKVICINHKWAIGYYFASGNNTPKIGDTCTVIHQGPAWHDTGEQITGYTLQEYPLPYLYARPADHFADAELTADELIEIALIETPELQPA